MNGVGETVDDQGSGWFQVKKKHRASSKLSVQSWVGGFAGKNVPVSRPSQSSFSEKVGNINARNHRLQPARVGGDPILHGQSVIADPVFATSEDKKVVSSDDKIVIDQDRGCQQLHTSLSSDNQNEDTQVILKEENDVVKKIKWGDLEDDTFIPYHEKNIGLEIRFGNIDDESILACKDLKEQSAVAIHVGKCKHSEENELNGEPLAAEDPSKIVQSESNNEADCRDVDLVSSEIAEKVNMVEKIVCLCDDISTRKEQSGHIESLDNDDPSSASPSGDQHCMMVQLAVPSVLVNEKFSNETNGQIPSGSMPLSQDHSGEKEKHQISMEYTSTASAEDTGDGLHIDSTALDLAQKSGKYVTAPGEDDSSESKERFRQRLWCFLFENINRAVDELYLLCELECDLEQTKEAILVLEEATSDFTELTSRMEKFEIGRRSNSMLTDGLPISLKTDHRRPHALSWEVRRMTTSSHKAEILSSSIEAFRKIQEERASIRRADDTCPGSGCLKCQHLPAGNVPSGEGGNPMIANANKSSIILRKQSGTAELVQGHLNCIGLSQKSHVSNIHPSVPRHKDSVASVVAGKSVREHRSEKERPPRKDKMLTDNSAEKPPKYADRLKKLAPVSEKEKEKNMNSWRTMDAWKDKRNWEDILSTPYHCSSRISRSPGLNRKSAERARTLHDKLMSPEKKKKTTMDLKKEAEERHARAMRIRNELENERMQKLQRTSEKLNRVNEWQAVRSMKLREGMYARHQRSESRHEAFLAQVVRRAGDETSKVNEVRFITSLNEENKKLILRQKLQDSEVRRAEKLQVMKIKQKEDLAREEAVLERRKLIEAEKLQRIAETQRKKEEAQVRREEERKASSAAREARAMEQLRRKEVRAKAQQEEAELLAQKLAERLRESELRRKFYLEQIRERASINFRDQSSPLLRRSTNKESRSTLTIISEDYQANDTSGMGDSTTREGNEGLQQSLKRRIKRIRQRLMALKHEFVEPPINSENTGIGYRAAVGSARAKIGRWLQELQRLRQARKEGAASIGLIAADMIKFLDGKEPELQASRQAGLLDFIASALPASHISKPEACQVTIHLLKVLRVLLSAPTNRSYFLCQNFLPPIIPMMSAALENYTKIAASLNVPIGTNSISSKASIEKFESISEVLDLFLWTVTIIIGHASSDEWQLQMRDGLLELLIAYQVIHRLRDLFALYDRPQMEGSPLPSSIVFSIQLLGVLTSSHVTRISIDWEFFPVEKELMLEGLTSKIDDPADSMLSQLNNPLGDKKISYEEGNISGSIHGWPEDSPSDELINRNAHTESSTLPGDRDKAPTVDSMVKVDGGNTILGNAPEVADVASETTVKSPANYKDCKSSDKSTVEKKDMISSTSKQSDMLLLSTISETGLVCLPSLLTSVLLQANNRLSIDQAAYILPSNFEEVATGALKFLNNLAFIDITFLQKMLARPDLKMEFFHLMSFLLSHCNSKWKSSNDQAGLLLLEALLLLGHFALFHHQNQAVLRWGNSPTILHKVCDLPFVFFSDPELMPVLAGTLVAACYGSEQNRSVVQQELSMEMLLSLLKSCKNVTGSAATKSSNLIDNLQSDWGEYNQMGVESRKSRAEKSMRYTRGSARGLRASLVKGASCGNGVKMGKRRGDRGAAKGGEGPSSESGAITGTHSPLILCRLPNSFISKAEKFFSEEVSITA
ncbi:hypothetical protein SAY87_003929 [Trapa incisa]|uniref:S phase cyclin A-associated protein in the endoplasmic reticulum N-terminal domain-containing protein n=1 Tax=Trapa incisa TaxID=236973 RepID=A0AAN7JN46_9MYRT|nr:hypothetical protein SAY87_003929 [Trapa incisa]